MATNTEPRLNNTRDILTISAAMCFVFLGAGAAQPFVISFVHEEKGYTLAQASLVLSLVYFVFVVFRFLIGHIIDILGLHCAKILGIATYAVFPFIVYKAQSYPVLLLGSVIWGIGAPMLWTSSIVQVMNTSPATHYGRSTGIVRGVTMAAIFFGTMLLSTVYEHRGYRAVFLLSAVLGVLGVVTMAMSPNRRLERSRPRFGAFFELMRSHEVKVVCALLLCSGLAYGLVLNGAKTYIHQQHGKEWLKTIMPFYSLAAIACCFLGGWLTDHFGRWPIFAWGFATGAAGMLLAWACPAPWALMVSLFLLGISFAVIPVAGFGWIGDRTSPADRTACMGYVMCFREFGVALAIQLRSLIEPVTDAFLIFGIVSAVCTVAAIAAGRLTRKAHCEAP